ncbi:alcohol dehydrogenase GroES domain protein [Hyaloraphidium curvatum]|nr:alcohol dehydrogenase GroES domain protein [Hyaloraphidium curvatum]
MATRVSQKVVEHGKPLQRVEEPMPKPKAGEVLIKVTSAGLCHSDIHVHDGYMDMGGGVKFPWAAMGVNTPIAMGHEIVGEVVELGEGATGVEAGSNVCPDGLSWLGLHLDGGFSTHIIVPKARYLIPFSTVSEEFASTLACSGLTAYGAIQKALATLPGGKFSDQQKLLIFGAGGLGLQAVKIVRTLFPDYKPSVADIDPAKREAALAAGAGEVIDPTDAAAMGKLAATAMATGYARAIDFVGAGPSVSNAFTLLQRGGVLIVVGLFGGVAQIPTLGFTVAGRKIEGHGTGTLTQLQELTKLASEGKIEPIPVQKRPLDDANAALEDLRVGSGAGRFTASAS